MNSFKGGREWEKNIIEIREFRTSNTWLLYKEWWISKIDWKEVVKEIEDNTEIMVV